MGKRRAINKWDMIILRDTVSNGTQTNYKWPDVHTFALEPKYFFSPFYYLLSLYLCCVFLTMLPTIISCSFIYLLSLQGDVFFAEM
jgi:hypothetical protein